MKNDWSHIDEAMQRDPTTSNPGDPFGRWGCILPANRGEVIIVVANNGPDWEHVGIHIEKVEQNQIIAPGHEAGKAEFFLRMPRMDEAQTVKDLFWEPEEDVFIVMHNAEGDGALHLWRRCSKVKADQAAGRYMAGLGVTSIDQHEAFVAGWEASLAVVTPPRV